MTGITIYMQYPVINGFVQYPNNDEANKTRLTIEQFQATVTSSDEVNLSVNKNKNTFIRSASDNSELNEI